MSNFQAAYSLVALFSFVRSYFLRRVFERLGIDDNFINLEIKAVRKLRLTISPRNPQ